MNVIKLRLCGELNAALSKVSRQRGLSRAAVAQEALRPFLGTQDVATNAAERWAVQWPGKLKLPGSSGLEAADSRLSHLLAKHVR